MANKTPAELLALYLRRGTRTYEETTALLTAWKFEERPTRRGHNVWVHDRGLTLTIITTRELPTAYRRLVVRKIRELKLLDD